jgi:hypothetical protein
VDTRKENVTIPTTKKQIERVAEYLDSEKTEGMSLDDVATTIVDGYHSLLRSELKRPVLIPHLDMAFKHPALSGVWHVAWQDGSKVWLVSASSRFGWFADEQDTFWEYAEQSTAKSGAPGNNPDWQVGDQVSQRQRQFRFEVLATGDKCVLLRNVDTLLLRVESNDNLKQHYRREVKTKEIAW